MLAGGAIGGEQGAATILRAGIAAAAEFGDVVDGSADSGDQLLDLRAGFPAVGERVGRGANLVGIEAQQVLALAVERAHVGAEKFVGRAGEKIAVEGADVDGTVGGVVDGVDEHEGAGGVGELGDFGDGIDGAYGV